MSTINVSESALRAIASVWQIGEHEVKITDTGFDWAPGSHIVHVRIASKPGSNRVRVWVDTEFLHAVPVEDKSFVMRSSELSEVYPCFSLVYPPAEIWRAHWEGSPADISMFTSVYVDEDTAWWLPRLLAQMSIMQPVWAEFKSTSAVELLKAGGPAHTHGKPVEVLDDILSVADSHFLPEGKKANNWSSTDEFQEFTAKYSPSDVCYAFGPGDRNGMTFETPFGEWTALVKFQTDLVHPDLGTGLVAKVFLPVPSNPDRIFIEAAELNFWESRWWTDFPQFGGWHCDTSGPGAPDLCHSTFIPNALYSPGLATSLALWSIARVQAVRKLRYPDMKDLTMLEILRDRFGNPEDLTNR